VEICRLFFLWCRYTDGTCYGADMQAVLLMVQIHRLYLLWCRYAGCS